MKEKYNNIIRAARDVRQNSYSPYSNYKVGAAVETNTGEIVAGCNVESSSYGLTLCAERNALSSAVAKGYKKFTSIAIVTEDGASPCGACRQVIWELCGDIPVLMINHNEEINIISSSDLLPYPFDDSNLRK